MMSDLFLDGYSSVVMIDEKENSNAARTPTKKNCQPNNYPGSDKSELCAQINQSDDNSNSLKKRALLSRCTNDLNRCSNEEFNPEHKKQRSLLSGNLATTASDEISSSDKDPVYPDSLKSYFEELSDGFRTDCKLFFESRIRDLDTSLKFLLPNTFSSSSSDSLQDLEIRSVGTTPTTISTMENPSRSSILSKEEKSAKQFQIDAAVRMRCPSMWDKKETNNPRLFLVQNPETLTGCTSVPVDINSAGSNVSATVKNEEKKGRKISLTKLYNNQSITYFPCDDNKILLLGNKRMMLVCKDASDIALANVEWCESVLDVDKCNMSFQSRSKGGIQLEIGTTTGKSYLIPFTDAASSGRIIQIIHDRMNQQNSQGQTSSALTPSNLHEKNESTQHQSHHTSTNYLIDSGSKVPSNVTTYKIDYGNHFPSNSGATSMNHTPVNAMRAAYGGNSNSISNTINSRNSDGNSNIERQLLSPMSSSLAKTVARQLKHGVGEIGLRGKLENDGVSVDKVDRILQSAKTIMSGSTPISTTPQSRTVLSTDQTLHHHPLRRKLIMGVAGESNDFRPSKLPRIEESLIGYDVERCSQGSPLKLDTGTLPSSSSSSSSDGIKSFVSSNEQYGPQHSSSNRLDDKVAPSSSSCDSDVVSNAETPLHLKKYQMMLKTGVPFTAVIAKMNMDKVSAQDQMKIEILQQTQVSPSVVIAATTSVPKSNEVPLPLKKYQMMLKTGIPTAVVSAKMTSDNVSEEDQRSILFAGITKKPTDVATNSSHESSESFPLHLKKYQMMLKTGVPLPAVIAKMNIENVSSDDQTIVTGNQLQESNCHTSQQDSNPMMPSGIPSHLKKFQMMIKTGVPLPAVMATMNLEKVSSADQALVTGDYASGANLSNTPNPTPMKLATEFPAHLKKFQMMIKTGVPLPAVMAKMNLEKVSSADQALVTGDSASSVVSGTPAAIVNNSVSTEVPAILKKYQLMLKSGVPMPAVIAKMTLDNVTAKDQSLVIGPSQPQATEKTPANAMSQNLKPASEQKSNGPKLLGLHWEPIDKDILDKSIWGSLAANDLSVALADEELNQLVSMFARKDGNVKAKESVVPSSTTTSSTLKDDQAKSKVITAKLIDSSRVMNISIGINSFKSRSLDMNKICCALDLLDTDVLTIDDVMRIKELLPSESEAKSLSTLPEAAAEGLHEAEKVLLKLCKVPDFRGKIAILIFLLNFEGSRKHIESCTHRLKAGAENAVSSEGLAEIMKSVLAIGNAMNDGTWKGGAVGFKLSSLTRLNQTKSADGSSTVMDYLIKILYGRIGNDLSGPTPASLALNVDTSLEELSMCKVVSLTELEKDLKSLQMDFKRFQAISIAIQSRKACEEDSIDVQVDDRAITRLQDQETKIQSILVTLEGSVTLARSAFAAMVAYFGETSASATTESLFGLLDNFISDLSRAKKKYISQKNRKVMM